MDERTFVGPIAQFLDPSRCLGACVVILFLRGSAGMVMHRELGCLEGLTDLHQGPREASQSRALRRCGFPLGQVREGVLVGQGHWTPPAPLPFQALELDSIRSHHWCIQGCSAVTGENLLPGIDWLLDDISSRIFTAD